MNNVRRNDKGKEMTIGGISIKIPQVIWVVTVGPTDRHVTELFTSNRSIMRDQQVSESTRSSSSKD